MKLQEKWALFSCLCCKDGESTAVFLLMNSPMMRCSKRQRTKFPMKIKQTRQPVVLQKPTIFCFIYLSVIWSNFLYCLCGAVVYPLNLVMSWYLWFIVTLNPYVIWLMNLCFYEIWSVNLYPYVLFLNTTSYLCLIMLDILGFHTFIHLLCNEYTKLAHLMLEHSWN